MTGDHGPRQMLDRDTCLCLLRSVEVGRVAWANDDHEAVVLPVTFVLDGEDVMFRTAAGAKLDAVRAGRVISFEADDLEPALEVGWSVLLIGHAALVTETGQNPVEHLPLPWDRRPKPYLIRLHTDRVSGYRLPLQGRGVTHQWEDES
jgi:nitroimidazol reductase NimA-like FMN-containing flavoprotein (pyridoxamine 5'-phosphate oxidase superfamily)